jgi:glycosyltransferase involved in cell wall biosynthesis
MPENCPLSVIVLSHNEEANMASCLESARELTEDIFVVDSFSTDNTLDIARRFTDNVYQNPWIDWASQRNWSLDNLPLSHEWVFFLDADERVTPGFAAELSHRLAQVPPEVAGLNVHFRFFFLGRPLKFAYESPPVLRVVRRGRGRWHGEGAREYANLQGNTWIIKSKLDHQNEKGLAAWSIKQTENAMRELQLRQDSPLLPRKALSQDHAYLTQERQSRRWLREKVYERLPRFWRTLLYFCYRYLLRGGFLDGKAGFAYCFFQALWYPLLIDSMLEEYNYYTK